MNSSRAGVKIENKAELKPLCRAALKNENRHFTQHQRKTIHNMTREMQGRKAKRSTSKATIIRTIIRVIMRLPFRGLAEEGESMQASCQL